MITARTAPISPPPPSPPWRPRGSGRRLAALLLPLLLMAGAPAAAGPGWMNQSQNQMEPQNLVKPGVSLEQAANMVRRRTGGRVLSATPVQRGGLRGYEVRVLVDGKRVKNVFVDSQGRIRSR